MAGLGQSMDTGGVGGIAQGAAAGTAIMPGWGTAIGAGLGLLGAIGGSQGTPNSSAQQTSYLQNINLRNFNDLNQGQSGLEANAYAGQLGAFTNLQQLVNQGNGFQAINQNTQFQNQYANQLQQLMSNIANPNQQQNFATAQQYFAPQQTALNQQFADQATQQNRLSAQLGRAGNDPTMRNMLMKEQTRQQTMLNSQIGAFGQQLPAMQAEQIMGVGNALSNLRGGLATQAMNNQSNLLMMGQQLSAAERNYRLQTAQKTGNQDTTGGGSSGGGMGGMISGLLGGAGAAAGILKGFG